MLRSRRRLTRVCSRVVVVVVVVVGLVGVCGVCGVLVVVVVGCCDDGVLVVGDW